MSNEIRNLEALITPILLPGQKFVSYDCENLLSAGENYGSVMLRIRIKIRNANEEEEILHCVGKTCPPSEFLLEVFNTKVTFKKEIAVYTTIVPALNDFGREHGIECLMDFFAKSLGSRISLDPESDEVDANAILLLENLKVQGYDTADRFVGFDEDSTRYLLQNLAVLHATPIAYKAAKPEEFKAKLLPFLNKDFHFYPKADMLDGLIQSATTAAARNPKCAPYLERMELVLRDTSKNTKDASKGRDIFATFTHNDFWVNNTMLKFEDGKPIGNRIVDFQVIEYSSLANDIVFFLYSSVELDVLERKMDELIRFYYDHFVQTLAKLKYPISVYNFESMMEEFALIARNNQLMHITYMLPALMTLKEKALVLSELKETDLLTNESSLHRNYYKRLQFVLLDLVKRGWI